MNIAEILSLKYPDADFTKDIILEDHGEGIVLAHWQLSDPQPTLEEITSWGTDPELIAKHNKVLNLPVNSPIYEKLKEIDGQSIRALRTNDIDKLTELEQKAVLLREQLI